MTSSAMSSIVLPLVGLNQRIEPATVLGVQVPHSPSRLHAVLARVIHTTEQPRGQFLLGCAFLAELSDQELQAFAEQSKLTVDEVRKRLSENGGLERMRHRLQNEKTLNELYKRAV